jgi:hypothetical protein
MTPSERADKCLQSGSGKNLPVALRAFLCLDIEAAITAAVAEERERAAKVCDALCDSARKQADAAHASHFYGIEQDHREAASAYANAAAAIRKGGSNG